MPNFNPFSSSKSKKTSTNHAKDQLSSLGLDPSLFDDPEFSDDENDENIENQDLLQSLSLSTPTIPKVKPIDVSSLLNEEQDITVELNEEDLDENSDLSKSLAQLSMTFDENGDEKEETNEQKLEKLEADLLECKRAAIFFKQQNEMEQVKEQLLEIRRIESEIKEFKELNEPQHQNFAYPVINLPTITKEMDSNENKVENKVVETVETPSIAIPVQINNENEIPGLALSPLNPESIQCSNISKSPIIIDLNTLPQVNQSINEKEIEENEENEENEIIVELPTITESSTPSKKLNSEIKTSLPNVSITTEDLEAEFMNLGEKEENEKDLFEMKIKQCDIEREECLSIALELKNNNNKEEAIKWLRIAILFKTAIEHLENKQDIDINEIISQKPKKSSKQTKQTENNSKETIKHTKPSKNESKERSKPPNTNEISAVEKKRILMFSALENKLTAQAERWKERALKCKAAGELPLAVKYFNERKLMLEDIGKIKSGKECKCMPLPDYTKEKYTHQQEVQFRNRIQPDEIEIAVVKATNIKPPSGSITVDSYVAVTCPFAIDTQIWKSHKVANTNSPVFKEVHKYKIERGKRTFLKVIERKKISFELLHTRWLRGDISLGKCELSINDIKSKAEIIEDLPILTNGKRDTGGKLSVRVRVSYPLLKKQILEETEEIIIIQKHFQDYPSEILSNQTDSINTSIPNPVTNNKQNIKPQQTNPSKTQTISNPTISSSTNKQSNSNVTTPTPVIKESIPKQPSIENKPKIESKNQIDEDIDYNPIETMVSNDVLEWALEEIQKEILLYKKQRKELPEELITKQQQVELKMQLLILQIQTGKMSEEQYIQSINDKIAEEKQLARKYLSEQNQIAAKLALTRAKIMTNELEAE